MIFKGVIENYRVKLPHFYWEWHFVRRKDISTALGKKGSGYAPFTHFIVYASFQICQIMKICLPVITL